MVRAVSNGDDSPIKSASTHSHVKSVLQIPGVVFGKGALTGFIAEDGTAPHDAAFGGSIVGGGTVEETAVVPHDDFAGAPLVTVDEVVWSDHAVEAFYIGATFVVV